MSPRAMGNYSDNLSWPFTATAAGVVAVGNPLLTASNRSAERPTPPDLFFDVFLICFVCVLPPLSPLFHQLPYITLSVSFDREWITLKRSRLWNRIYNPPFSSLKQSPSSFPTQEVARARVLLPQPSSMRGVGVMVAPQAVQPQPNAPVSVCAVQFGLVSSADAHRLSVLPCRRVVGTQEYGVNDKRLGVCERMSNCSTCGKTNDTCAGHSGHIDLELPVFHAGFFLTILRICRTICKTCSRVLLEPEEVAYYTRKLEAQMEAQQRIALVKRIQEDAYKTHLCPYCGAVNGVVKRGRPLRMIHDKYTVALRRSERREEDALQQVRTEFRSAVESNKDLSDRIPKMVEVLDPVRVRQLFSRLQPHEVVLLGFQPQLAHPLDMLVSTIVVPPVCARPGGGMGGSTQAREDDLTTQLNEIIICSDSLKDGANDVIKYAETWDLLQTRVARLLDAQLPGFPAALRSSDTKSYAQRIKGKHGRFRGNLSGKRVDFSGRSVISPDPNLDVDELAVPLSVARVLTYPQRVYAHNIEMLRRMVRNGPSVHPGAVTVLLSSENSRRSLRHPRDRQALATRLAVGDVVERHVINGDMIIFNRQPSLHRISMMAHRARVLPYRTFRFNECCCSPYNADFDGDEMNVHLVQTEEARAEALELMLTARNIITAKNGEPIIACTQDFLTASYLVTSRECFYDRSQFTQMVSHWLGPHTRYELPIPALLRPTELWTGKQLFELILRPSPSEPILLNLEAKARGYSRNFRHWDPNEGFVSFLDSKFVSGRLDKKLLGGGAKDSLFARLFALTNGDYTARCMSRIAHFTSRYLQNYGFSLGLGDVSPTQSLNVEKEKALRAAFEECDQLIHKASKGLLAPLPGMTLKQSLEAKLNGILSKVRDTCGAAAKLALDPRSNAPLIMVNSGSKGSELNTAQMMACVGQQTVSGKRIVNAFDDRSLPHFHRYAEDPAARGFVASSFFSGLSPTEFFFHTMAGREGLVDTAVKTAETGYLYRRLSKAMENVSVRYDNTVRNGHDEIIQFKHGEDGMDPWLMEGSNGTPLNLDLEWLSCRSGYSRQERRRREARDTLENYLLREAQLNEERNRDEQRRNIEAIERALMSPSAVNEGYAFSLLPDTVLKYVQRILDGDEALLRSAEERQEREQKEIRQAAAVSHHENKGPVFLAGEATRFLRRVQSRRMFCQRFQQDVIKFFQGKVSELRRLRELLELPLTTRADDVFVESLQSELLPMTPSMIFYFMEQCAKKYVKKMCEPGTPCGSIAAQSVGEPSTQMTLRTFHFAGVASMNITQGVPRLKEIINANVNISTPVVTAPIKVVLDGMPSHLPHSPEALRREYHEACLYVKGRVERVCLKDVMVEMVEMITASSFQILVRLNLKKIDKLRLPIDAYTVRASILKFASKPMSSLRQLKEDNVQVISHDALYVYPFQRESTKLFFNMKQLLTLLPNIVVGGINGVNRVMVSEDIQAPQILAEGTDLRSVMTLPYVDGRRCRCNHVAVIERTLGIEAARQTIVDEICSIMQAYSLNIDIRHIYLLADVMTHRGSVLGITRYGLQKMSNSVLTMASFERTTEHLYNAAVFQRKDAHLDVSDSIIVGQQIPLGSQSFNVLMDEGASAVQGLRDMVYERNGVYSGSKPMGMGHLRRQNLERWSGCARSAVPTTTYHRPLAAEDTFRVDIFV
eukprot:gene11976-8249_t